MAAEKIETASVTPASPHGHFFRQSGWLMIANVGMISGGAQPNIVPDRCVITIDRRTLPGET